MIREQDVLFELGGNYTLLADFMNRRTVKPMAYVFPSVTLVGSACVALDNTMIEGKIAKGLATRAHGGMMCAELTIRTTGTTSLKMIKDEYGNILNKIEIRDAASHEAVMSEGKRVFGLLQCVKDTVDGAPIGAPGAENIQITFAYIADNNAVTATAITAEIEFQTNLLIVQRFRSTIEMEVNANSTNGGSGSSTSGDLHVTFTQATPELMWSINHAMGKNPSVMLRDLDGNMLDGFVEYTDSNNITITFTEAVAGVAELN